MLDQIAIGWNYCQEGKGQQRHDNLEIWSLSSYDNESMGDRMRGFCIRAPYLSFFLVVPRDQKWTSKEVKTPSGTLKRLHAEGLIESCGQERVNNSLKGVWKLTEDGKHMKVRAMTQ